MIDSVYFENFRGLQHLELPELSQITLLTGRNNAGKSSVLDGIFLFMDHTEVDSFGKINNFRGLNVKATPSSLWDPAFYKLNSQNPIHIAMKLDGEYCDLRYIRDDHYLPVDAGGEVQTSFRQFSASNRSVYTLKFHFSRGSYSEDGFFSIHENGILRNLETSSKKNEIAPLPGTRFITVASPLRSDDSEIAEWLGQIELKGKKQQIIDILQSVEPGISDIIPIVSQGQIQVYIRAQQQLLPLRLSGDGMSRLLFLILALLETPYSILLIDEIGAGFHYSMLEHLWAHIASCARENHCQVIATTHSYECIQNAVTGIEKAGMRDDFCLYRMERQDGDTSGFQLDADQLRYSMDANLEVR